MLLNFILAVIFKRRKYSGTSMAVQWLRLCALSAGTTGSIPGQAKKVPQCSEKRKKKKEKIFNANLQEQQADRDCSAKNLYSNLKADSGSFGASHIRHGTLTFLPKTVWPKDQILFSPYIICIKPIRHAREICILGLVILFSIKSKQSQYIKIFCFLSLWFLESCWGLFLSQNKIPISGKSVIPFPPHQPQVFWGSGMMLPQHSVLTPITLLCKYLFPLLPPWLHHRRIFLIFLSFTLIPPVFTEHCVTHSRILVNFGSGVDEDMEILMTRKQRWGEYLSLPEMMALSVGPFSKKRVV